jgi:hypothetical protein
MTFRLLPVVLLIVFAIIEPGTYIIHVEARSNVGARPVVSRDMLIRVR